MSRSLRNKRSLTSKINSNKVENNEQVVKKRKHLTIKSDINEETSNCDWKPLNWKNTLEDIRKMRKDVIAPVDDMGCDQAADLNESPEVYTYKIIMLKYRIIIILFLLSFNISFVFIIKMYLFNNHIYTNINVIGNTVSCTNFIDVIKSN